MASSSMPTNGFSKANSLRAGFVNSRLKMPLIAALFAVSSSSMPTNGFSKANYLRAGFVNSRLKMPLIAALFAVSSSSMPTNGFSKANSLRAGFVNSRLKMPLFAALFAALFAVSSGLMAADWVISQDATISAAHTSLTQRNTTDARQAVNGASVEYTKDSLTNLVQTVNSNGAQLELTQGGDPTNDSIQAINFASANEILDASQHASHSGGDITLLQDMSVGSDNIQAINYAVAGATINGSTQSFIAENLNLRKAATTPVGNIQAVNYLSAPQIRGQIGQSVVVDNLAYDNAAGNDAGIRINSLQGNSNATISQSVTVNDTMTVTPSSGRVIINYLDITERP